jgi:hypothetical protein
MIDFSAAFIESKKSLMWILYRPWAPFHGHERWPSWVPNIGLSFSSAHFHWTMGDFSASEGLDTRENFTAHVSPKDGLLVCDRIFLDAMHQVSTSIASKSRKQSEIFDSQPGLLEEIARQAGVGVHFIRETQWQAWLGDLPGGDQPPSIPPRTLSGHRYNDVGGLKRALSECLTSLKLIPISETESIFDIPQDTITAAEFDVDLMAVKRATTITMPALYALKQFVNLRNDLDFWGSKLQDFFAPAGQPPSLQWEDRNLLIGRLFMTCSGYVGTALCNVQAGDKIYILRRCLMPVVLRLSAKRDGAWELIGAAYISGVMKGEAVTEHNDQGGAVTRITLC